MAILEVRGLMMRFGGVMALNAVDMDVPTGEITGLIGPNGAGKTTLFNVINGMLEPSSGTVRLSGVDATRFPPHRRAKLGLARTFQRLELFASLSVRDNVRVAAELAGRRHIKRAVERILTRVGLEHVADRTAGELPTGSARLVEIARALATQPTVLLLDEPASGLGDAETAHLAALLHDLAKEGLAILLVEHDVNFIMDVCDSIYVLDLGEVIAHGTPEEIRHDPLVLSAYLGAS
jgi:branched-chain amino acid transport system ATP-binding protein